MRQRSKAFSVLKRSGIVSSLGLMAIWALSTQIDCTYGSDNRKPGWTINLRFGELSLAVQNPNYPMAWRAQEPSGWKIQRLNNPYWMTQRQRLGLSAPERRYCSKPETHYFLPLWLPFMIVASPTIALIVLDRRRKAANILIRREQRLGKVPSVALGIGTFLAFVFGSQFVCDLINRTFFPEGHEPMIYMEIMVFLVILAAYLCGRIVYSRSRWRLTMISPEQCHSCNYNLTGNTSGICPECGTATPAGAPEP
jgi:hypothetical protein